MKCSYIVGEDQGLWDRKEVAENRKQFIVWQDDLNSQQNKYILELFLILFFGGKLLSKL